MWFCNLPSANCSRLKDIKEMLKLNEIPDPKQEKTLESPLDCKEIQPVHPKGNQSWLFIGGTEAEAETPILWPPDADSLEKTLMLGKIEGGRRRGGRGWDGWMASLTLWAWVWVNSGGWWWTGRPGVLQSVASLRVRQDCATELNWTERELHRVWDPSLHSSLIGWWWYHIISL